MEEIKILDPDRFMRTFMRPEGEMPRILRDFGGRFFIIPVEEMISQTKLPVPPTKSTTHTIIYLTEGEANLKIGYHAYRIGPQECLVVAAGQVFSFDRYEVNRGYVLNFGNDALGGNLGYADASQAFEFLNPWGQPWIRLAADDAKAAEASLERINALFLRSGLGEQGLLSAHLNAFLEELKHSQATMVTNPNRRAMELTRQFKELLFQQLRVLHQVAAYAERLHVSPNHLNKVLKSTTGKSPSRWIDEALVTEAKVLLFQTNLTIGEIALTLGIDDSSYFSRLFRKVEGRSPQAFRKMIDLS